MIANELSIQEKEETDNTTSFDANLLNQIRDKIETMNKYNQVEVLRILSKHKEVTLNENKYGVHINLSELKPHLIQELSKFIHYVQYQESALFQQEQEKETFKNTFFVAPK